MSKQSELKAQIKQLIIEVKLCDKMGYQCSPDQIENVNRKIMVYNGNRKFYQKPLQPL